MGMRAYCLLLKCHANNNQPSFTPIPSAPPLTLPLHSPCRPPSQDLARLSLSDPEYLAVHSEAASATPLKLDQAYAQVRGGGGRGAGPPPPH